MAALGEVAGGDETEAGGAEDDAEAAEDVEDRNVGVLNAVEGFESVGGGGDSGTEIDFDGGLRWRWKLVLDVMDWWTAAEVPRIPVDPDMAFKR